jgi:NADH-quinone oxidoreductase subunit A
MATTTQIAAYLALFFAIGGIFLFVNLLVGRFVRPHDPHPEKQEIYECGEPTIGSSFVQFDLRFYVVALVFIVFDAEVAFLFPAATVFGKQTELARIADQEGALKTDAAEKMFAEMQVTAPSASETSTAAALNKTMNEFTWYVYAATLVFFVVLFVGFAYEWKTGAFDWVRAVKQERGREPPASALSATLENEPALTS